jgi:hypothetical protein
MRLGQKNARTQRQALRGTQLRALAGLRTEAADLFGMICPRVLRNLPGSENADRIAQ